VPRGTKEQSIGEGIVRLAAFKGRNIISVLHLQNSEVISVAGDTSIRCTVVLFNPGLRIYANETTINQNYVTNLAKIQWHILNNPFVFGGRKVLVSQINPLMKGMIYGTENRLDGYLTGLTSAMTVLGAATVPMTIGPRNYNGYKLPDPRGR